MSVLNVLTYPNPILKQLTHTVTVFDEQLVHLSNDLIDTMRHYKGVGLAAPQIGILEKLFVIEFEDTLITFINPEILHSHGQDNAYESCLSIPSVTVNIERATTISIKAQDVNGSFFEHTYDNYISRIFQHEIDHINQTLIIDKGTPEYE